MSASERLECPLLRCRKRFPNHEEMLQHLYACEELTTGEYWCYDCGKAERFTDAKCKRCLGHPTKRRKILSMAKSFFSQLGHKSRKGGMGEMELDDDVNMPPPPSYDSLDLEAQVELFSTEILEIDSTEIAAMPLPTPLPILHSSIVPSELLRQPSARHPAELESMPILPDSLLAWEPNSSGHMPEIEYIDRSQNVSPISPERPSLQLDTHGLSQYRSKVRSKALAPSSSVRSTTSTTSTTSTASSGISPMSAWSGAWTMASGMDTTLTSPTSDLTSPGGLLHSNSLRFSRANGIAECKDASSDMPNVLHDMFSELPADFPNPHALPGPPHEDLCHDQPFFSFDTSVTTELSITSNMAFTDDPVNPLDIPQIPPDDPITSCVEATSFVGAAWDALQAHITSSLTKLQHVTGNTLVDQLKVMPPKTVAAKGLSTLRAILDGHTPAVPVDVLCFVHLAYSLSLVAHEHYAEKQSEKLFAQAVAYCNQFPPELRSAYANVATSIWQPGDISQVQLQELILPQYAGTVSRSGSLKGKERDVAENYERKSDALVSAAQYFLDGTEKPALIMLLVTFG
jgi:hypothetical protein